jgi:hypothetical protein
MSSLTRSLEKRIQELKSSIHSQEAELAAYEKVLDIELANPGESYQVEVSSAGPKKKTQPTQTRSHENQRPAVETGIAPTTGIDTIPEFSGSKSDLVVKVLEARGIAGATAKEIDEVFSAKRIARSDNLIYNALSLLRKERKLDKKNGRYYFVSSDSARKPAAARKHRISAAGIKRIREANKKRWAEKRAAQNGVAKSTSGKSAHRAIGASAKPTK